MQRWRFVLSLVVVSLAAGGHRANADTRLASTTTLTAAPAPSGFLQPYTLTATVAAVPPAGGSPSGKVQFLSSGVIVGVAPIVGGQASLTTTVVTPGSLTFTARYVGDDTFQPSLSPPVGQVVAPLASSTFTVMLSVPTAVLAGAPLTVAATVVPLGGGAPTGSVQFFDGGTLVATGSVLPIGTQFWAVASVTFTTAGRRVLTARYLGDVTFVGSVSMPYGVTVYTGTPPAATTTTLTASPIPSIVGQAVQFLATVGAPAGTPTGVVDFYADGIALGNATLAPATGGASATFNSTLLPKGVHLLSALYRGAGSLASSASGPVLMCVDCAAANATPLAVSGPVQFVSPGTIVQLDGSASSDLEDAPLQFSWSMALRPAASTAALSDATAVRPSFVADKTGLYAIDLTVNDGVLTSPPSRVYVVAIAFSNARPVASAGPDQAVTVGQIVHLDGSASTDADTATLGYSWLMVSRPAGSTAALSDRAAVTPAFLADVAGPYLLELVVNDGLLNSTPDIVVVTAQPPVNLPPIANAGPDQTVPGGSLVHLNATGSHDPEGAPLLYQWSFTAKPAESDAVLSDPLSATPTFTADVRGVYGVQLIVSDGLQPSTADTVMITANRIPVADAGPDRAIHVGVPVHLNGAGSTDIDDDAALTYSWTLLTTPAGSGAVLDVPTSVTPSFLPDVPGDYVVRLTVSDGVSTATDTVGLSTGNLPPVADAGADRTVSVGETTWLSAAASWDPNGHPTTLSYQWAIASAPSGSMAGLSAPSSVETSFTPDLPGAYSFQLIAGDGTVSSDPRTVTIFTANTPPVADPGSNRTVVAGDLVQLDASGSTDVDGDALSYHWTLLTTPAGSTAALSDPSAPRPTVTVDVPGNYVAQLVVTDAIGFSSAPETVLLTTDNVAPIAAAGPDQAVSTGATVTLDGTASHDANDDPLSLAWALIAKPAGSTAVLDGLDTSNPTFFPDLPGPYVAQLLVSDSIHTSVGDTVFVTTGNARPVANAGSDRIVATGANVSLDASASSDANGDGLTVRWAMLSRPAGSSASLSNPTAPAPEFVADLAGLYVLQLIVHDGTVPSAPDTVAIAATDNNPPVANAGSDQSVLIGATVQLDGGASVDPDGDPLTYLWSFLEVPAGSTAALLNPTTAAPSFVADMAGSYSIDLTVTDSFGATSHDTVAVTVAALPVVTVAATDNAASEAGPDSATFTLTRTGELSEALTVGFTVGGSATEGDDFTPIGTSATFAAGAATVNIGIMPVDDAADEDAEDVVLTLTDAAGYDVGAEATAVVTVDDNDVPTVTIAATDEAASEAGLDSGTVTVTRVGMTTAPLDVLYTVGGTATADDFTPALTGTLTIPAGQLSATLTITPVDDADFEDSETVSLTITAHAAYGVGASDTAVVTIADNDVPTVTIAATDAAANEVDFDSGSPDGGTFTITRTGVTTAALDVLYTIGGSATVSDFTPALTGALTIPAGQPSATITITPLKDVLVEGPETVVLTLVDGDPYDLGAPGTETAAVTIADAPPITLSLVDTPVVGVALSATLQVTLAAPAPAEGVVVTVTSDNTAFVAVAAPGTATIPEGGTTGQVTLNGISAGLTTVRAKAPGYDRAALDVKVTYSLIAIPATLNVPLSHSVSLPITLVRDVDATGEVVVDVVSDNPAAVSVTTPSVTVPAGQLSANATVFGQGVGSANLRATIHNFVPGATIATTTGTLNITVATLTINDSTFGGGTLTIQIESPPGQVVAAPAGGVVVGLTTTDAACVAVPGTATVAQGTTSVEVPVTYGGSATLPCSATISVSGPTGFTGDTVSVTVNPAPGITVPAFSALGGGLQGGSFTGQLGASNHGGVTVHVASADSARVLVAPNATTPGAASLDIPVANGTTSFTFYLQGMDWGGGSSAAAVTITATATGFADGSNTVSYVEPALRLANVPPTTTALSANVNFQVQVGTPSAGNGNLALVQPRRAGGGTLTVTITNSTASVAELDPDGGGAGAQMRTVAIAEGQSTSPGGAGGIEFDPLNVGTTTVSASIPGFIATTAAATTVTVTGSGITVPALSSLGGGLQSGPFTGQLGAPNHGGVTVHVASADSARVLVAPNGTTPGATSLDIPVADGVTAFTFFLQGMDWGGGSSAASVTITASATGFADGSNTVSYVQPALRLTNVPATTTALSANVNFQAQVGTPSAGNGNLSLVQPRRAGGGTLTVTITNSTASVAELDPDGGGAGAQVRTVAIAEGQSTSPGGAGGIEFDPLNVGTTTVSASIPEFIVTTASTQLVTVTGAGISMPAFSSLGGGLQSGSFAGQLGAPNHGGVTVHVASADSARVLVAPNATTAGAAFLDIPVADGTITFTFFLQGLDWGGGSSAASVTITASATGFADGSNTVSYVQPALRLANVPAATTVLSANVNFQAQVGTPSAGNGNLSLVQPRRAGGGSLTVTITNDTASVAELDPDGGGAGAQVRTVAIAEGQSTSPGGAGGIEFDPLNVGTTTVSASIPGFIATTVATTTVTVGTPGISLPATSTVGAGLQSNVLTGTLGASAHGGVTVHLTSSDASRLLLAPDAATAGGASLDIPVANGATAFSFVVQGTDWVDGVSSGATVIITAEAPGFTDDTAPTDYRQAALRLSGLVLSTTAAGVNDDFTVQVGTPSAGNTNLTTIQVRRAEAPPLTVTVTNSNASVAEIDPNGGGAGAQAQTASIAAGQATTPNGVAGGLEFDPLGAGTTIVTASIPGFIVTTAGSQSVTVSP